MSETQNPVLPGWFSTGEQPHLLGTKCSACGTFYFPALESFCRNPACDSTQFESVELSRKGKLWSFTDAQYAPPEPYVAPDPYEPFAIAAVELAGLLVVVVLAFAVVRLACKQGTQQSDTCNGAGGCRTL